MRRATWEGARGGRERKAEGGGGGGGGGGRTGGGRKKKGEEEEDDEKVLAPHMYSQHTQHSTNTPVTVLTSALLVATMERPGSMISVRPDDVTTSRTVSIRSVGDGSTSPLHTTKVQHGPAVCLSLNQL